jgi:hypothetical protein
MIVDVGIAGILVDQAFAPSEMVITDLKDHLDLISSNVERNLCQNVKVLEYDWCHPPPLGTFDIILVFEWCDPPTALASSLTSLFSPSLLPCCQCVQRRALRAIDRVSEALVP